MQTIYTVVSAVLLIIIGAAALRAQQPKQYPLTAANPTELPQVQRDASPSQDQVALPPLPSFDSLELNTQAHIATGIYKGQPRAEPIRPATQMLGIHSTDVNRRPRNVYTINRPTPGSPRVQSKTGPTKTSVNIREVTWPSATPFGSGNKPITVGMVRRQAAEKRASTNIRKNEAPTDLIRPAYKTPTDSPTINRFTLTRQVRQAWDVAQPMQLEDLGATIPESEQTTEPEQTGAGDTSARLLNADAMIAPLGSARQLLSRLDISPELIDRAVLIESGPRQSADSMQWPISSYSWISPVFYHDPLFFEQPNLERYGHGKRCLVQPVISSAHFFGSIFLVPYKLTTHHPRERLYTLGNSRPGNCVAVQHRAFIGPSTPGELFLFWKPGSGYR